MMRPRDSKWAVYLHREAVDFRLAINGLSVLIEQGLGRSPFVEAFYVFINRGRNKIKILYWERNGFCLWQKRLEKDRFAWPDSGQDEIVSLRIEELEWLLDGFDIWRAPPHKMLSFHSVA